LVERGIDVASACKLANLSRASYYRPERDWHKQDAAVIDAINNELKRSPQAGFWKCYGRIRHKGYPFNHNEERTHESLGHLPPAAYRAKLENSSLEMPH
jgi:hypothetical protein